ncbi:hypothetical protein B0H13DRAFT_2317780 [Mycena leptocephala]|nr:hypothetical protein B0H13DRAFT_2317780 [Mycena leptocephala]
MSPTHAYESKSVSSHRRVVFFYLQPPPITLPRLSLTAPSLLPPPYFILQVPPVPTLTPTHHSSDRYRIYLRSHLLWPTMYLAPARPTRALPFSNPISSFPLSLCTITHPPLRALSGIYLRSHLLQPTMDLVPAIPTRANPLPDLTHLYRYHVSLPPPACRSASSRPVPPSNSCSISSFNFTLFNSPSLCHLILA